MKINTYGILTIILFIFLLGCTGQPAADTRTTGDEDTSRDMVEAGTTGPQTAGTTKKCLTPELLEQYCSVAAEDKPLIVQNCYGILPTPGRSIILRVQDYGPDFTGWDERRVMETYENYKEAGKAFDFEGVGTKAWVQTDRAVSNVNEVEEQKYSFHVINKNRYYEFVVSNEPRRHGTTCSIEQMKQLAQDFIKQ